MTRVHVAVAVLETAEGEVLLSGRNHHTVLSNAWEFPGGKIEPSESAQQALQRELQEELDIEPKSFTPLIQTWFDYPHISVHLHAFHVTTWQGQIHAREKQHIRWVAKQDLLQQPLLQASLPIARALLLPDKYMITPEGLDLPALQAYILQAEKDHAPLWIQYRDPGCDPKTYLHRGAQLQQTCSTPLVFNTSLAYAEKLHAQAIHINSQRLHALSQKPENLCVGASAHTAADIAKANQLQLDYILLSPVAKTHSHPDAAPLGWETFSQLTQTCTMPVYALGGMKQEDRYLAKRAGGQGIAGIGCFQPH